MACLHKKLHCKLLFQCSQYMSDFCAEEASCSDPGIQLNKSHSLEPGVLADLSNGDAFFGIHHQHALYEPLCLIRDPNIRRE